ncbi:MAG TPA: DNA-3-methyladenine glycosylase I [candidate division Zixibacteria bacterium]|nr:DNA-3-methyladenine glycosylase I [candidate division Zixibacteria bacterium]
MNEARTYWFIRNTKPVPDNRIFENLTRVIFQGGLTWELMQKRWPNFQKAFADFSIDEVANFTDDDLSRLLEDEGIIRNSQKIEATLYNAQEFKAIIDEFGSFSNFLESLDKSENYSKVIKELIKRFKRLGKKSSYIFLYSIGENIKWDLPEK